MALTILSEPELRRCVGLDLELVDAIEGGFTALAAGDVVMPPILHMAIGQARGEVDVKTAHVPGMDSFAIKVSWPGPRPDVSRCGIGAMPWRCCPSWPRRL
jgi:ornithine cyclodeaminase